MIADLNILWHWWRLGRNWNKMTAIAVSTDATHQMLMQVHPVYREASRCYNESKRYLIAEGKYITAESILREKQMSSRDVG